MPDPLPGEGHDDFIDRCMGDGEAVEDFPDPDQRLAFCESTWEGSDMGAKATKHLRMMVADFEVKQLDRGERTFEGDLSTSHLDLGNGFERDIVHPGAFKRTLDHFENAEDPYIPLLDSHDQFSILSVYGHMLSGEEIKTGEVLNYELEGGETLEVEEMVLRTGWQVIEGPDGDRILDRLRPGSVRKMSMGYRPVTWDRNTLADGTTLRNLREVKLREGSLVVFGMNPEAEVDLETVKGLLDRMVKGDEISDAQREELVRVYEQLGALLEDGDEGKTDDPPEDPPEGPAADEMERVRKRIRKVLADSLATRIDAARRSSASVITRL